MTQANDWASETEQRVLDEALRLVPTRGWSRDTVVAAAAAAGLSTAEAELLLPHGARDLAACCRAATTPGRWRRSRCRTPRR